MKTVVKVLLVLAVVALVCPAFAEDAKPKRQPPTAVGVLKSVDATAKSFILTITKEGEQPKDETFKVLDDTKVSLDGETATLDKLVVGKRCAVWVTDGKLTRVSQRTKEREKKPQ